MQLFNDDVIGDAANGNWFEQFIYTKSLRQSLYCGHFWPIDDIAWNCAGTPHLPLNAQTYLQMYAIAVDIFVCIPHALFLCVCKVVKIMQFWSCSYLSCANIFLCMFCFIMGSNIYYTFTMNLWVIMSYPQPLWQWHHQLQHPSNGCRNCSRHHHPHMPPYTSPEQQTPSNGCCEGDAEEDKVYLPDR